MIVVDASAMVELIARAEKVPELARHVAAAPRIAAPAILDFEILNVLRRQVQEKIVSTDQANSALQSYLAFNIERHDTLLLTDRIWALRNNFTSYDAAYIALAEALQVPLFTKDKKLVGKHGHVADVRLVTLVD